MWVTTAIRTRTVLKRDIMARVNNTTEKEKGTEVSFECPLCGQQETQAIITPDEGYIEHACDAERATYPMLPTVSLTGTPIDELSLEERIEMQLASVTVAHRFVRRYRATSYQLLFAVPSIIAAIVTASLSAITNIVVPVAFQEALQTSLLLFVAYIFSVLMLGLGIVAVWGVGQNLQLAVDYIELTGYEGSLMQFVASIGNYHATDPFKQWFNDATFLKPSNDDYPDSIEHEV